MKKDFSNKVAVASAIIALIALIGAAVSWQRDSAMPWVMQWVKERGERLRQLEERIDAHEHLHHPGRLPSEKNK